MVICARGKSRTSPAFRVVDFGSGTFHGPFVVCML